MKYIEFINGLIKNQVASADNAVVFGQNINAGSCLGGLTRNLKVKEGSLIINTQNSENALCGIGFGLMMQGVNSVYFMKQQDFLLLGIDHLANTYNFIRRENCIERYNFIRRKSPKASFTVFCIVVDCGYQGLQSSLNNFADICSLARVPGFAITNKVDAEQIINSELFSPGFRIIGISQRLFSEQLLEIEKIYSNSNNTVFQYTEGADATIACFNFSLPYGLELQKKLQEKGRAASLFSVNALTKTDWNEIIRNAEKTKNLIIIDDSKSENLSCYILANDADKCALKHKIIITKDMSGDWLSPNADRLEINYDEIINRIK